MELSTVATRLLFSQAVFIYAIKKKNELAELVMPSSHSFAMGTRNWKAVTHARGKMKGACSRVGVAVVKMNKGGCNCCGDEGRDDKGASV